MRRVRDDVAAHRPEEEAGRALEMAAGESGAAPIGGTRGMKREESARSGHEERGGYIRKPA